MSKGPAKHPPMDQFSVADDCIQVGGVAITELAERVGQTPFYAYDRGLISERIAMLRDTLPDIVSVHYAVKANPMPAVVNHVSRLVDGLDVASLGELQIALDCGTPASEISFAGPGKTPDELMAALVAGITVNIESENELRTVAKLGRKHHVQPRVAVRVNPDFELKASGMKMGGGPKQFGIDAERVPETLREIGRLELDFRGFHIFCGSQNLSAGAIVEAQIKTVDLALRLAEDAPGPVKLLNIGGGFGIPYFPGDTPLELGPIAENLAECSSRVAAKCPEAEIVLELGRYLVGEAGVYVARVIDRKVSRGQVFLVTNGGLHHHLAASGNFGQVIRKNYPVVIGNRVAGSEREIVSVVGPLCTPLDLLADHMEMAKADVGDLVLVYQSGAYGMTASPTAFLSHPGPKEVLV